MKEVRVRIAPSPTGAMHLGLVRTALYNWLFARRHGGRFILRIDDTDVQRNMAEVLEPILAGLRWLGIDWDEGPEKGGPHAPYFQSQRAERHRQAVAELVARGAAYYDYASAEETRAERDTAVREKRPTRYSRRWMGDTLEKRQQFEAEGRKPVVRLLMPDSGRLTVRDLIRGDVEFDWALEQDHVIARNDGSCLYHLASIVDDHDMGISHIIRAEEHLSNTPRQIFIARALGWDLPEFAHLPFVAEPGSKNKLSKRKLAQYLKGKDFAELVARGRRIAARLGIDTGDELFNPVTVDFYEKTGFLPEALVNYIVLLGWSLDDKTEDFTREQLTAGFSLDKVNKAPAGFDPGKLMAFQVRHMMALPLDERAGRCMPFLVRSGLAPDNATTRDKTKRIVAAAGDRIKVAGDILDYEDFFVPDGRLGYDEKAFAKRMTPAAAALLERFSAALAEVDPFEPAQLEQALAAFVAAEGVGTGDIIHALRVAVTGKPVGFGLFDTMAIVGKESCRARLERALKKTGPMGPMAEEASDG